MEIERIELSSRNGNYVVISASASSSSREGEEKNNNDTKKKNPLPQLITSISSSGPKGSY